VVGEIILAVVDFVQTDWKPPISALVAVPPSKPRLIQPIDLLSQSLGSALALPLLSGAVVKTKPTSQLKNIEEYSKKVDALKDAFQAQSIGLPNLLLVDDVYKSGATIAAVTETLAMANPGIEIYTLAITRTHRR
jgi:predicted amidophosphoribosyltransferase